MWLGDPRSVVIVLVTGGSGFIGSHLIDYLLGERLVERLVNYDLLTYAGRRDNNAAWADDPRYRFVRGDTCDASALGSALDGVDLVLHLAAESHVDRSIGGAHDFVRTNVLGTQTVLDQARLCDVDRVVVVSTDEVYGSLAWRDPRRGLGKDRFTETHPVSGRSPYAASKAGADLLALAAHETHGLDVVITRCGNNYGPRQLSEKFIPRAITTLLDGKPVPLYGDGLHVRDWIHVADHCRGIFLAATRGAMGRVYNFGSSNEQTNRDVATNIGTILGLASTPLAFVADRLGHDRRYAVNPTRAHNELGWRPTIGWEKGLRETVAWYQEQARCGHGVDKDAIPSVSGEIEALASASVLPQTHKVPPDAVARLV